MPATHDPELTSVFAKWFVHLDPKVRVAACRQLIEQASEGYAIVGGYAEAAELLADLSGEYDERRDAA